MRNHNSLRLLIVASAALLSSCVGRECDTFCRYKNALVAAVMTADRIVLSEHASGYELMKLEDQKNNTWTPGPMTVYRETELTPEARARFLKRVRVMLAEEPKLYFACVPEYHHSMTFYYGQKAASRLLICSQCGQTEWTDVAESAPWDLVPALARTVKAAGFELERDWDALAKASASASAH